jgi:2'-5' RNA ligase
MNGIASLLDKSASVKVEFLWQELEVRCGLVGVKITPFPHFSWQVAEAYDLSLLATGLGTLSRKAEPLTVHTAGLGLFTGENPIVYIPIIKDKPLISFHKLLWEQMTGIALHPSPYYSPSLWIPHITLAFNDINHDNLDCAMRILAYQSFEWEIQIDNLVTIVQDRDQPPETVRYYFGT